MGPEERSENRIVWLWQGQGRTQDRVATTECPVSFVTGESLAFVEDFYTCQTLGGAPDVLGWAARRVDAFVELRAELKKTELEANGKR